MKKLLALFLTAALIITSVIIAGGETQEPGKTDNKTETKTKTETETEPSAEVSGEDFFNKSIIMYIGNSKSYVQGTEKQIDAGNNNVSPYIIDGRTFIPVRFAAEALGGTVDWDDKTRTASITTEENEIIIAIGEKSISLIDRSTGEQSSINMDAAAELKGGRVCVPVRYIAEALGKQVSYDRGLIIISDGIVSIQDSKTKIDEIISMFTGIKVVGNKENLIDIIGFDPQESQQYYSAGILTDDVAEDAAMAEAPAMQNSAARESGAQQPTPAPSAPEPAMANDAANITKEADAESAVADQDYSETNIQVKGVDEADIIKTDGQYIYHLHESVLEIIKVNTDGSMEKMSQLGTDDLTRKYNNENLHLKDFFVEGDKIVITSSISVEFQQKPDSDDSEIPIKPAVSSDIEIDVSDRAFYRPGYYLYYKNYTGAHIIDISDRTKPTLERELSLRGNIIDSRRIGNNIYFITQEYLSNGGDSYLPDYYDSTAGIAAREIPLGDIRYFPFIIDQSYVLISSFDISNPQQEIKNETFLGCGNNIYMSDSSLYIAGQNWRSGETEVYKFAVSNGEIVFANKGSVPGTVLNQFSMDEHNSYFRIATNSFERTSVNNLYVLDSNMDITGSVENIAPGERIYSARFMGDRAYMVTFRQTDPLYTIDLSDPDDPKIMGALKIPGFSNYLHPYDENHLIGFGKETEVNENGSVLEQGMKISLFDVSDISDPKEMFVEIIGGRGTNSALLNNHRALLFSKEKNLLAFPIEVFDESKYPNSWENGAFEFAGAYVYTIDLENGFEKRGEITHLDSSDLLKASKYGGDYDKYIDRIIYIGDLLYSVSNRVIMSNDILTTQKLHELKY